MQYTVLSGQELSVQIDRKSDFSKPFEIIVGGKPYRVSIRKTHADGRLMTLMINHRVYPVEVEWQPTGAPGKVILKGIPFDVDITNVESSRYRPPMPGRVVSGMIKAPLPGLILDLRVAVGDKVKSGQSLLMLEAMKMENDITAPKDGVINKIHATKGQNVAKGDVILEIS